MNFTIETGIPVLTVFLQGLLSFFSPCVLPLVPLYMGYFAGTSREGNRKVRIFINTVFFVLGISVAFFLLGFGFTTLGQFFNEQRIWLSRVSGIIMILLGLYQSGLLGSFSSLEKEHRIHLSVDRVAMGPLPALLLGFTFSFSWTPCVGPALTSVLLLASSSGQGGIAALLIGIYTIGFIIPFLLVGLFSDHVLTLFQRYKNAVKYTVKAGAFILIIMGVMTLTGFMNGVTNYLSDASDSGVSTSDADASQAEVMPPDIQLADQYGISHQLSNYQGKTIFLNFWATWCGPCRSEMDDIQELYEKFGENQEDVIILGLAAPQWGKEGTEAEISAFLKENGYTYPVLMDHDGVWLSAYGIRAYPTTYFITPSGQLFGYIEGAMTKDIMESAIRQTQDAESPA